METDRRAVRRASLGRALRKGFRDAYDHLGYVATVTFLSFVCSAALMSAVVFAWRQMGTSFGMAKIVFALPVMLQAWLWAVGVFHYADRSVHHEHPSLGDTWVGVKTLLGPAILLFALDIVVSVVLLGDMVFFLGARGGAVFAILGVACGYLLLVWLMMMMYHLPLLAAERRTEAGPRALVMVRKSFLLMADNPGFTVGLFLVIIAFAVVCAIPGFVGMAVVYLGATAFVLTHALRELFIKYGIVEEEPEVVEDQGWPKQGR